MYNYTKLCAELDVTVMATEYSHGGFFGYAQWITARATDALRGDVAVKGGITACLKGAHLAEGFNMKFELHHGGNSLNNVANLHVALAIDNCDWFEVLLPHGAQKYGLVRDLDIDADGCMALPDEAPDSARDRLRSDQAQHGRRAAVTTSGADVAVKNDRSVQAQEPATAS